MDSQNLNTLNSMNRKAIIQSLDTLSTAKGYTFYNGADPLLPQRVKRYPAVWLSPLRFKSMEGRNHGKMTYSLTLRALAHAAKLNPAEHEAVWQGMERDVIEIFSSLSQQASIVAVENLSLKSDIATLSSSGELALEATAEVVTYF